jgi:hypothetical protein
VNSPVIKIILIALILVVLTWGLRHRDDVGLRAGRRLTVLLLAGFAIVAVIAPELTTRLANAVGVGRGTDLLLYALVVTFVFTTAGLYFRCRDIERRLVEISRAVALRDAISTGGPPGEPPAPRRG